jgi:hypothetical protein
VIAAAVGAAVTADPGTTDTYGPKSVLICRWFTNFENSKFLNCSAADGRRYSPKNGASIECTKEVREQMDSEARRALGSPDAGPPSGVLIVRLIGQIALHQHRARFLNAGSGAVLVSKVLAMRKAD